MTKKKWIAILVIVACVVLCILLSYARNYSVRRENVFTTSTAHSYALFYNIERLQDGNISKEFHMFLEERDIYYDGSICLGDNKDEIIWFLTRLNNFDTESVNEKLRLEYADENETGYSYYYTETDDDNFVIWEFTHNNPYESNEHWVSGYDEREFVGKIPIEDVIGTIDALENYNYPNVNTILFMKKYGEGFITFLMWVVGCIGVLCVFWLFYLTDN